MNNKPSVSILVVTHNHAEYIPKLLQSLETFDYENVFFCDADSKDNTLKILNDSSFSGNILPKKILEGFSKNNNDLIRHFKLSSDYYLLLNPDVYFTEDFLSVLLEKAQKDTTIGIASPLTYYPNNQIQVTWKKFPSIGQVFKKRMGILKATKEKQTDQAEWVLGSCMLISNKLLKKDNTLLDERYRLYCEDIDICFECTYKKMKILTVKDTFVYHHLNELSSKNIWSKYNYWNIVSILKFALKWNFKYIFRNA